MKLVSLANPHTTPHFCPISNFNASRKTRLTWFQLIGRPDMTDTSPISWFPELLLSAWRSSTNCTETIWALLRMNSIKVPVFQKCMTWQQRLAFLCCFPYVLCSVTVTNQYFVGTILYFVLRDSPVLWKFWALLTCWEKILRRLKPTASLLPD